MTGGRLVINDAAACICCYHASKTMQFICAECKLCMSAQAFAQPHELQNAMAAGHELYLVGDLQADTQNCTDEQAIETR